MARIYFRRAAGGYRAVRGEVIRRVQAALKASGSDPKDIDGIFGGDTENALRDFQRKQGLDVDGRLDHDTWVKLMKGQPPGVFDRCLQLTADFEDHGFQKLVGNFDGAGLTWGIIGFTLQHGELQNILNQVRSEHPALFGQAFGSLGQELVDILGQSWSRQRAWADSISTGSRKYRVQPRWEAAFSVLGTFAEVQAIQLERVKGYWDRAVRDAERFGLRTEMGISLCFDIAVQNGGIDTGPEQARINTWRDNHPKAAEGELRVCIADVVAENSKPQYVEDVRGRKRTIAAGDGTVHGARYATRDWGIEEEVWQV